MRDLTQKEMTEVSGGFFSFFDRSNFHSQNGDPTRGTAYTRNVHTPDGNGGFAGTEVIGTPTSPTGLGGGGAAFALGLNTPSFGTFEPIQFEPVTISPQEPEDPLDAIPDCEPHQLEGVCELPSGNFLVNGMVVSETALRELTGATPGSEIDVIGVLTDLGLIGISALGGLGIGVLAGPGAVGVQGSGTFTAGEIIGSGVLVGSSGLQTVDELRDQP